MLINIFKKVQACSKINLNILDFYLFILMAILVKYLKIQIILDYFFSQYQKI